MTAVLIDANVLLDVIAEDKRWLAWSTEALERASERYRLVINPVIYAEVSIRYSRIEALDAARRKPRSTVKRSLTKPPFLLARRFSIIADGVGQSDRRCPISSSARTLPLRDIS